MKTNKWQILMRLMLMMVIALSFTSCSKDEEEENPTADNEKIAGVWAGYNAKKTIGFVMGLYKDNSMVATMIYTDSDNQTKTEESTGTYRYSSASGELTLSYSDGGNETFRVTNLTSTTCTLYIGDAPFYMEKSTNNNSGGSSSSGSGSSGGSSGNGNKTKCKYCLGSGNCSNYVNSSSNKYYCLGSKKCQWCGGDGLIDAFGINNAKCSNCYLYKGSGICSYCEGSGKCSRCKGSGYQ